jgi:hypothetical protein
MNEKDLEASIIENLEKIVSIDNEIERLAIEKQRIKNSIYTKEIREKLAEIDAEFAKEEEGAIKNRTDAEAKAKQDTLKLGRTVNGSLWSCEYNHGKMSKDPKKFEAAVAAHPEIFNDIFTKGKDYISLKKVNRKEKENAE